jgi:HEPN domain-containing protein
MGNTFLHQYQLLYRKAVSDLEIAKLAFASGDELIDDATIIFHIQQAAEKLTKSLLAYHNCHFEKTHDLTTLVELCNKNHVQLPNFSAQFYYLNPFAVIGRYDIVNSKAFDIKLWINRIEEYIIFVKNMINE